MTQDHILEVLVLVLNQKSWSWSLRSQFGLGLEALWFFYSTPQCLHCKRCTSYGNSVRLSVRPSICLSVTRQYCVKMTAHSTVQFALSDSKMCLVLQKLKYIPQERPLPLKSWLQVTYPLLKAARRVWTPFAL